MFRLRVTVEGARGDVTVENPVRDESAYQGIARTLEFLAGFPTAGDAYRARLLEVARGPRGEGGGLGLLRIAYEGGGRLSVTSEGGRVRVTAALEFAAADAGPR